MDRICSFGDWLLLKESSSRRPASKSGLYPLGYGGIGNYPPSWWISAAADAMLYITQDERLFDNGIQGPWSIEHIPGDEQSDKWIDNPHHGENAPFDIRKIPGKVVKPKDTTMPGKIVKPKSYVKLVTKTTTISPKGFNLPE